MKNGDNFKLIGEFTSDQKRILELERELRAVKQERDAAVADLGSLAATSQPCDVCAMLYRCNKDDMDRCEKSSMFVWRGKLGVE